MDTEDYCELCDLPRSQCIHGLPPPAPKSATPSAPRVRKKPAPTVRVRSAAPEKLVVRRWTPPEAFKPLILEALSKAGGELEAEEMFLELEILAEDRLKPGDLEKTPEGELRWRYAARRARIALIDEGLMTKDRPGIWELAKRR
ncbi:MAG: hypothetical protein U0R80_00680 [Nocardioidaceae bacterium]